MIITNLALATMIGMGATATDLKPIDESLEWVPLGKCRITTYCAYCNDGAGHESSTGTYLKYGHVACRWLEPGTIISIGGEQFEVVDTCGTDAIDIYLESNNGRCTCNLNEWRNVSIKRGEK